MRLTLYVFLLATAARASAAAPPVVGTWEGVDHGVKSATITVREDGGVLSGSAIFYIVQDEGSGAHDGAAMLAMAMVGAAWDGSVLRFSVVTGEGRSVAFELRGTGEGKGELRRLAKDDVPELTIPMTRAR